MSVTTLNSIQAQLGRYGISILLVIGNIGNLFVILVLRHTLKQNMNSCALYLLCAALANWLVIDTALASSLYGIDHVEPIHTSNLLCKLRWYGGHVLFLMSRHFMIAACIDRWALCSPKANIRKICRPKIASHATIVIIITSVLIHIPLFFYFNNKSGRCAVDPSYFLAYTVYSLIFIGILPSILMIFFNFLGHYNLKKIRSRVRPNCQEILTPYRLIHRRDHDLMKMLFGEVFLFIVTTCPFSCYTLYTYVTAPITPYKSLLRVAIEQLGGFIIHPLLAYTYCCTQFYVYAGFSRKFREDFLELLHLRRRRFCIQLAIRRTVPNVERH